jgi:hypothetical protein
VWVDGGLPFHVTDASKLQVICPLKYRMYADRIQENVPIFKEDILFGKHTKAKGAGSFFNIAGAPVMAGVSGDDTAAPPAIDAEHVLEPIGEEDVDELMSLSDVPCAGSAEEVKADTSIRVRSKSR